MTGFNPDRAMLAPPALWLGMRDRRLSKQDKFALIVCWQVLRADEYRPLKAETLAHLIHVKRQSAARTLVRLVDAGYLTCFRETPRSQRLFLVVNVPPQQPETKTAA